MLNSISADLPPARGFRLNSGRVLQTTPVFEMYWHFAFERQQMFYRRMEGLNPPWTMDPILRAYRFTNVYRASDRVSQYLIRHVIYEGDAREEEVFFRTVLFKLFNRIETWQLLEKELGRLTWRSFRLEQYNSVLDAAMQRGTTIYSPAYIMPSPPFGASRKHANHLHLLVLMMKERAPEKIASAHSLKEIYARLRSFPSLGDFLAFQFAIDLNYSEIVNFSEMDFVVAGPGARSGIRKSFVDTDGLTDEQIIHEVTAAADREFESRGLSFRSLWGRPLHLIDCQNLFCEVDKYARVALPMITGEGRTRIKRKYSPALRSTPQWYPPKWGLQVRTNGNVLLPR